MTEKKKNTDIVKLDPQDLKSIPEGTGKAQDINKQLSLFQQFLCNTGTEKRELSNLIEFWDIVPRYSISQVSMAKMRNTTGHLPLLKNDFEYGGRKYTALIQPIIIEEKKKDKTTGLTTTVQMAYYPSSDEELVEEVLRKIAVQYPDQGYYDENSMLVGVYFSLYQVREELKARGHARSLGDIKRSLFILSKCNIQLIDVGGTAAYAPFESTSYLPRLTGVLSKAGGIDADVKWRALFHPLVTTSIEKLSYRQFNYQMLMSHTRQLSRWLHRLLIDKYTFASMMNPFELRYSTVKRDSAMLNNFAAERQAQSYCKLCLDELVKNHVLSKVTVNKSFATRGKVVDIIYTLLPSQDFIAEIKASNKRQKDSRLKLESGDQLPPGTF